MEFNAWNGFQSGEWQKKINVRDFIDKNYTPYEGDGAFLAGPTERTKRALAELERLKALEQERGGVLDDGGVRRHVRHGPDRRPAAGEAP